MLMTYFVCFWVALGLHLFYVLFTFVDWRATRSGWSIKSQVALRKRAQSARKFTNSFKFIPLAVVWPVTIIYLVGLGVRKVRAQAIMDTNGEFN